MIAAENSSTCLRGDLKEVDLLASRQRTYARQVIAWLADEVRSAESRRDTITRACREAAERLATEQQSAEEIAGRDRLLEERIPDDRAEIDGFKDSDAYREGSRLLELRGQIQRRADVKAAEGSLARATTRVSDAETSVAKATDKVSTAEANLVHARQQLDIAASAANADSVAAEATASAENFADADDGERLIGADITARRQSIKDVRAALRGRSGAATARGAR